MGIKVEKINDKLCVVIPPEYKEPYWLDTMYRDKYTKMEDGSIVIPCRDCNVKITKPMMVQTPMGMMQQQQVFNELWRYFDVPGVSALVDEGADLLDSWTVEKLGLELKETQQLEGAKKDEDTNLS